jgi:hypothetical protein
MGASEETTVINPRLHDERTAQLHGDLSKAQDKLHSAVERLHRSVGDKRINKYTRQERWALYLSEAIAEARRQADDTPLDHAIHDYSPVNALRAYELAADEVRELREEIEGREQVWREHGWSRYILCLSASGHIHNYTGCHTLQPTTALQWHPEFSGLSEEEAINGTDGHEGLGPILCTHCYPSAPVEFKRDPAEWKRERNAGAKAAEKAEREAKKAAKNLRPEEQFQDTWGWVTTVAGAIKVLRDEREYYYYFGRGPHPSHAKTDESAKIARRVLLAREAEHEGWGLSQDGIDQVVARADKKNRKEAGL